MTLEEAIRFHTEEAEKMKLHRKVNEIILGTDTYKRELKEHTQTAEWLKELAERRKQPEIIYCKDCEWYKTHSSWNCKKYYYCARESITATVKTENDFCSKAKKRTDGK